MNKCIAENKYTLTKELFYEGMKRVSMENDAPFAKKAILGIAAAWVIMSAVTIFLGQNLVYILFEAVVLLLVSLWIAVYLPWHKRKNAWNKFLDQYGSDTERTTRFYEDSLVVDAAGREVSISYEDIVKILSSEHLLIILTEDNTGILIEKNSFIRGSESDILEIIQN